MGTFDRIKVYDKCPYCGKKQTFTAKTKDLGRNMYTYTTVRPDEEDLIDRSNMPVYPKHPEDPAPEHWDSQEQRRKTQAKPPEKHTEQLKYVEVTVSCNSTQCQFDSDRRMIIKQGTPSGAGKHFKGKIKINEDGRLEGGIYDKEKDDFYTEVDLSKYKEEYSKTFEKLKNEYGPHEPIIARNWPDKPVEEQ